MERQELKSQPSKYLLMAAGYDQIDFWKAYCRFFFACPNGQDGIHNLADTLANQLTSSQVNPDRPLHVLCLGIGVAGFEYPLLASLQRHFERSIQVVGIDKSPETLNVSAVLCENLTREFDSSDNFANFVADKWHVAHTNERFLTLDLDGRGGIPITGKPWTGDDPSDWVDRLNPNIIPEGGFDLVIAAFCYHHVHWWRSTLGNALTILRPGGLMLLSQVDGDVSLFDWNQQEQWLLDERKGQSPGDLEKIMANFWNHRFLRRHMLERPQAGAVRPWAQIDLLERLPLERIPLDKTHQYLARNKLSVSDVEAIMLTTGLSPFRRAQDYFLAEFKDNKEGKSAYAEHVKKSCSEYRSSPEIPTLNRIQWHGFVRPEDEQLNQSPVFQKFTSSRKCQKQDGRGRRLSPSLMEYELMESSAVAHETFHSALLDNPAFENFLEKLILSGALDQNTPFGVMGQRLIRQEKFTASSLCFSNPLGSPEPLNELMLYMCLRQTEALKNFSNSNTLLNDILPLFNVPAVFSYVREDVPKVQADGSVTRPSIGIELQRYRSFLEIRFRIKMPANFQQIVAGTADLGRCINIVSEATTEMASRRAKEKKEKKEKGEMAPGSFVLPIPVIAESTKEEFQKAAEAVRQTFLRDPLDLRSAHKDLEQSWKRLASFANWDPPGRDQALTDHRRSRLEGAFSLEMAETIYWLSLVPGWHQVVIFPATYSNPNGEGVRADDSLILFYRERLSDTMLRHEFRKVASMLDQLNMRRLATSGELSGLSEQVTSQSHELSKQTGFLSSTCFREASALFEINGKPRTNRLDDPSDWPEPMGKIVVDCEYENQIANWLICPMPSVFSSLTDYLTLWAGARGTFGKLAPKAQTLQDLVLIGKEIALNSRCAVVLQSQSAKSLEGVQEIEEKLQSSLLGFSKIIIEEGSFDGILIDPRSVENRDALEQVLVLFIRVFAAAISNAVQHTPDPTKTVRLRLTRSNDGVLFEARNPVMHRDDKPVTADGTAGVIKSCLRLLDKDTTDPECLKIEDGSGGEYWITRFTLNNPTQLKATPIKWLFDVTSS